MEINELTAEECSGFLEHASLGRLGSSFENQPYVVPIYFAYHDGYLYIFSTYGQKVKWMRANPTVCVQTDEIQSQSEWVSVIAYGDYEELPEPQYSAEREHASSLLGKRYQWWLNALGERQMRVGETAIEPLFFRIRIHSMSGLRATDEKRGTISC
jgi:nitroimidazol reductase NimA-like FMN-containing flavoprotein (pyridoxamine 5'-phosphate oxidase superfamily)